MPSHSRCEGSKFRYRPEPEHPLPQLGRVGQVPGVPVRVPALHHAVLDHQAHAALAGVLHERREHALGLAQVLGHAAAGIASDEGPDGHAAQRRGGVDAGAQVRVVGLALGRVGGQVVVVVGQRRQGQAVLGQRAQHAVGLGLVEGVGLHVAGGERPVAQVRPRGQLQRLVAVARRPRGDLLELALGHAGGQEAELHGATTGASTAPARSEATSTQRPSRAEVRTASVISAARRPSANAGMPSSGAPVRIAS